MTEALRCRRERGFAPFTIMSCDNIQGNGDVARTAFSSFATLVDPELGEWVRTGIAFPNSMVDRITPVTTAEDIAEISDHFGVNDARPVVCEPLRVAHEWLVSDTLAEIHSRAGRRVGDNFASELERRVIELWHLDDTVGGATASRLFVASWPTPSAW